MTKHRVYSIPFATVYPLYLQKVGKKGRTKQEVDEVVCAILAPEWRALRHVQATSGG